MNGLYIVSRKDLIIHVLYYVAPYVQCSLGIYVLAFCETLEFYLDKKHFMAQVTIICTILSYHTGLENLVLKVGCHLDHYHFQTPLDLPTYQTILSNYTCNEMFYSPSCLEVKGKLKTRTSAQYHS